MKISKSASLILDNGILCSFYLIPALNLFILYILRFGTKALTLLGCGVRVKTIGPIKAKVYSVGLYAEKFGISGKLSKFKTLDVNK